MAGPFYVNDDGDNSDGLTLAKAKTTFAAGVALLSAGEDLYLGMDHSEALGVDTTYTFPGTAAAPNRVISINTTTENYDKADNVQLDASGGSKDIIFVGFVKCYGISMKLSDDFKAISSPQSVLLDDSVVELTSVSAKVLYGHANGENTLHLKNTDINFSGGGASASIAANFVGGILIHEGGTVSLTGTQPTALYTSLFKLAVVSVVGVDLSAITSALVLISDAGTALVDLRHCLLNSGVALTSGTIATVGTKVLMSGCDDTTGNDLYRLEYVDYYGSIVHDDAIYRTAGAKDPDGNNISWKMVTTANAKEFSEPLISTPIVKQIKTTGSKTFTVHVNWDSAIDLDNDEIWLEVEYLEASADVDSAFANDGLADILATPAAQATSTEAWTGTSGFTNENKQKLDVTVTVNRVGPVICRVHLAKPSVTVYVDPKVEVA